ncbi:SDR family NAD(P)-dependent oxidoreductase [Mycolicibacterium aubagnense]
MPRIGPVFGVSHPVEIGAKRLVDGLVSGSLNSGRFYASAQNTVSGPMVDQADILPDFADDTIQDHAYAAIHAFLPDEEQSHS